jgi:uncharacterized protein (TIRG00374 family)
MTHKMKKNKIGWLRWLPGIVISLVAIYALYRSVNWRDLGLSFRNINLGMLFVAILILFIAMIFRTLEWWLVADRRDSIANMYLALNVGYLVNNILPFRMGELIRAMFFGQTSNTGTFYALSTIIIERVFDVGLAAFLLFISIPQITGASWVKTTCYIAMGLVITALIILFIIANNREKFKTWLERKTRKSFFFQKHIQSRIGSLLEGLTALTSWKIFLGSFSLLAVSWAISLLEFFIVLRSFIPEATFWWAVFSMGVLALGIAIPSAPAYIGVFEASLVAALAVVNVDPSRSLAFAILIHFYHVVINSLIGLIGIIRQGKSLQYWFSNLIPGKAKSVQE